MLLRFWAKADEHTLFPVFITLSFSSRPSIVNSLHFFFRQTAILAREAAILIHALIHLVPSSLSIFVMVFKMAAPLSEKIEGRPVYSPSPLPLSAVHE